MSLRHVDVHRRQLEVLNLIAENIATRSGQRQILQDILDILEAELELHRGTVMLLSPNEGELVVEATRSIYQIKSNNNRYRRGEGITGRVLQPRDLKGSLRKAGPDLERDELNRIVRVGSAVQLLVDFVESLPDVRFGPFIKRFAFDG